MQPTLHFHDGYPDSTPYLSNDVRDLQSALSRWGFSMTPDGKFGQSTLSAVKAFQRRHGLDDDGVVGPRTWSLLQGKAPANISSGSPPPQPLADVQYAQIAGNFDSLIPDSKYFTWHEALYLPSWERHCHADEVSPSILTNIVRQAQALDKVRDHFNASIIVHCWLRPMAYNKHIGGANNSAHLRGSATDFHMTGYTAQQVRQVLMGDPSIYPGAGEKGVSWVHLDLEHHAWFGKG